MTEQRREMRQDEPMREDEKERSREGSEGDAELPAAAGAKVGGSVQPDGGEPADAGNERAPLLSTSDAETFRQRWENLQAGFVDEPRQMVEQADDLVGELMEQLSAGFREERSSLEAQWEQGDDVSTEDLRVALTRYRSFFNRLLSA